MTQPSPLLILLLATSALAGCAAGPHGRGGAGGTGGTGAAGTVGATAGTGGVLPRTQAGPANVVASARNAAAIEQVASSERAFAQTLTDHDLKGFVGFLSPDAIFFSGNTVEHGVAEIVNVWAPFFAGSAHAPFSWQPDHVEVSADGRLALSTGPILQQGKAVARFTSIWRLEGKSWHIVFDKGEPVCSSGPASS